MQRDVNSTALGEAVNVFLKSGFEADLVEQGRIEQIGHGADVLIDVSNQGFEVDHRLSVIRNLAVSCGDKVGDLDAGGGEQLPDAIMQLAREASALLVLRLKNSGGKFAQLLAGGKQFSGSFIHLALKFGLVCT